MKSEKKRGTGMFVFACVLTFIAAFGAGVASKIAIKPAWGKNTWSN